MASILDKYGIKEVADVTFYKIGTDGKPEVPVLYIDSAKTTTTEFTADEITANGGKGNPALISWDSNKDINVTLEDALFSAKSLAIMFGDDGRYSTVSSGKIMKTQIFKATSASSSTLTTNVVTTDYGQGLTFEGPDGKNYEKKNMKIFTVDNEAATQITTGTTYFCSYDLVMAGTVIDIGPNTFPGTYYVTADTYARSETTGDDEFFQLIFPKAKVKAENTITLEADGDPTVFNMDLHILKPSSGPMVQLVKYSLTGGTAGTGTEATLIHNHSLDVNNEEEEG